MSQVGRIRLWTDLSQAGEIKWARQSLAGANPPQREFRPIRCAAIPLQTRTRKIDVMGLERVKGQEQEPIGQIRRVLFDGIDPSSSGWDSTS